MGMVAVPVCVAVADIQANCRQRENQRAPQHLHVHVEKQHLGVSGAYMHGNTNEKRLSQVGRRKLGKDCDDHFGHR